MKCIRLLENGNIIFDKDMDLPKPNTGECLIKVRRSGICNTDLEIIKGYSNFQGIMGHEFVGNVELITPSVEENDEVKKMSIQNGVRVVGEINLPCNTCSACKTGGIPKRNHCLNRTVLGIIRKNGTFAEYITLPRSNLFIVPDNVTDKQAAFVEPLAAAFRIVEQLTFSPSLDIAIIGDGKLGLLIAEVISLQKCRRLVLFGHHPEKMALVSSGSKKSGSIPITSIKSDSKTMNSGEFNDTFDVTIDACGAPEGLEMAGKITRPLGTIIMKTTIADNKSPINRSLFVVKEQCLVGSRCGNFTMALEALSAGSINVDKFISREFRLEEYDQAFQAASAKGAMKMQFVISEA